MPAAARLVLQRSTLNVQAASIYGDEAAR